MKKRLSITEAAIKYKSITILITSLLLIYGVYALLTMPRQEFPEFTIRQGVIVAVMPGATSEQIESQVATPIENYLFGFKEINKPKTYSRSQDGVVYIFVELNENVKQPSEFWSKIKHGMNVLKSSLPSDVYGIFVNDDFGSTSAVLISIESDSKSYKDLETMIKGLESRLRQVPAVSKLNRVGTQTDVVSVKLRPEKMSYYGVKPLMILMSLRSEGSVAYGGDVRNDVLELPVHLSERYQTAQDIGEQIIYNDPRGNVVRIRDVAEVVKETKTPDSYITNNQKKCLVLSIEMLEGNNIVEFGTKVRKIIDDYKAELPKDVNITTITNQADIVGNSISQFMKEFGIAIAAVILVTMLLLPFRVASIAGITIPLAVMISIGIVALFNMQLDTVSLASLILVLGMVVDNSIIIIDNYIEKLDHRVPPMRAAVDSVKELFIPVLTATLAILSTYIPFALFLSGVGKEFIQAFPVVIGITLGISVLVAALLVPIMCYTMIKKGIVNHDETKKQRKTILDIMQSAYDWSLEKAFRFPKITIGIGIASVLIGGVFALNVDRELFPKLERNQFAVEIYLSEGSTLARTDSVTKALEHILMQDPRSTNVAAFVGTSSPRFHTVYAPNMPAKNYAQLIVNTVTGEDALEMLDEYSAKYTNMFPEAHIRFKQLDFQATTAPIEIRIMGDSITDLKSVAEQVENIFRGNPDVAWVRNDYLEPKQSVMFDVNNSEMSRIGLTKFDLTTSLMIARKGMPIAKIWEGDHPVDIELSQINSRVEKDFELNDMYVPSLLSTNHVPLRMVATPRPSWSEGQIVRRNGIRTLTVLVDVNRGVYASDVYEENIAKINSIQLPKGVSIGFGGEKFDEGEQYPGLIKSLIVGVCCIFFILLFQFRRIKTTTLIMATMPLSLFGATFGLIVTGNPFGFTAFIGLISLCGMVVRNGIILVDYANNHRFENNLDFRSAAIVAGKRRMRPIFLTSAAAAVGVVPMIVFKSPLWAPLASVLCFGLIFSMIFTLIVLPVLYWYFFRSEEEHHAAPASDEEDVNE